MNTTNPEGNYGEAGRPARKGVHASRRSWLVMQFREILRDGPGTIGLIILLVFFFIAAFGDSLTPYGPNDLQYLEDGSLARGEPPSARYWFGTTTAGRDVFSQTLSGARVAVVVGFLSAIVTVFIGSNVALWAGYSGGKLDEFLMGLVDITYGIPFLPFAIVLVSLLGTSIWNVILIISLLFWRSTARVIRAQVLSLKQRPFIWSARAAGAKPAYIIYRHILPNVLPLILLYTALAVSTGVLTEAGLSFLGFGDPRFPSWGTMLNDAFRAGAARRAWWWIVPPGACIALFVTASYMVGRAFEASTDPRLREYGG
ncbi:MAG: ABC transporter permease [Anaerolineae bacterium]|nr:ABC transporter permease [Anaerolineae bacterium]MBN8617660.1 ABC transporter permease [Anaerolineae bacterium]